MIYTRLGTEVKLLAPVNWNTGFVFIDRNGVVREVHISDLKADGGINEIQAASDALPPAHLCRDCWRPMEVIQQPQINGKSPLTIVTCKNHDCTLYGVTLSKDGYETLTIEQLSEYRKMVANHKARVAKRGGQNE